MTKLPVKVLLDENKKPFVPYMTTRTVLSEVGEQTLEEEMNALRESVAAIPTNVMKYKGSVANYAALQQITNPAIGDVYNTLDTGNNYAWDGNNWDIFGGAVDLSSYYTKDETDNAINDAIENVEVDVDLSDYYNKSETDTAIADAISAMPTVSGGLFKQYKINIPKPSDAGGAKDVSGYGQAVANAIMDAAAEGKIPVLYSDTVYGYFFPLFTLAETKTATAFSFAGPAYAYNNSSNVGLAGMLYARFSMKSNDNGVLTYSSSAVGAGQLSVLNSTRFLSTTNTKAYTPSADYHPATKIYVDNLIAEVDAKIGTTEAVLDEVLGAELVQDDIEVPDAG